MIKRKILHQKILDELKIIYEKLQLIEDQDIEVVESLYIKRKNLINILKESNFRSSSDEEKSLFIDLMELDKKVIKNLSREMDTTLKEIKSHHLVKKTHQAYLSYGGKNGKS